METYRGYFIDGDARFTHPNDPSWYPRSTVMKPGRLSSVIEVERFEVPSFKVDDEIVAKWFGLEIAKIIVDECLPVAARPRA